MVIDTEKVMCSCGCGELIESYNKYGKKRRFVSGHNSKIGLGGFQKGNKTKSQFKKGHKGYKFWQGKKRSEDTIAKMSSKAKGIRRSKKTEFQKGNHPKTEFKIGHKPSKETLKKLEKIWKSAKWKNMAIERRSKQILPLKDTSIEIKIKGFLDKLEILYEQHKYIGEIKHAYQCDFYIPVQERVNKIIIIECDGCFFHLCPICKPKEYSWTRKQNHKDNKRTAELKGKGFKVIRLWEHEIKDITLEKFKQILMKSNEQTSAL